MKTLGPRPLIDSACFLLLDKSPDMLGTKYRGIISYLVYSNCKLLFDCTGAAVCLYLSAHRETLGIFPGIYRHVIL